MAPGGAEASGIAARLQAGSARSVPRLPGTRGAGTLSERVSSSAQRPPGAGMTLEGVGHAVMEILLLALAGAAGLTVLFALTVFGLLPNPEEVLWSAVISGPILLGTAGLTYLGLERLLERADGPVRPLQPPDGRPRAGFGLGVAVALGSTLLATGGAVALAALQNLVFEQEVVEQEAILKLVEEGDPLALTLLVISAVVLAPLTEELTFRQMFFRRLYQRAGPAFAWTLPAVVFALVHFNLVGLLIYAWLASVFALAYWFTGRVWVAMLVHAGHNAFTVTVLLLAPDAIP